MLPQLTSLSLRSGARPTPGELLDALAPTFPLIAQLAETPQDPEWHAEGNVRIHTEMVIAEAYKLIDNEKAAPEFTVPLILGAALHDIGKALTTREEEIGGVTRITSPRHAARGRSYVAPRLPALGLERETFDRVLAIIGHHHDPRKLLVRHPEQYRFWRLARIVETRLIYLLEIADIKGRICRHDDAIETLELFRIAAEDAAAWDVDDPYKTWLETIATQTESLPSESTAYIFHEARRQFENGDITTPEEAIAKTYPHRESFPNLVLTCGPSGAGKSHWVKKNLPDHTKISLDEIREELTGRRDRMTKEGQVLQSAKKRLRELLRRKERIVWDATNLREDGRAAILGIAHDYHAHTRIVAFATPPNTLHRQNRSRPHPVPQKILDRQLDRLQWPNAHESHQFETVFAP